jgi:hypothetical protein
MSPMGRELLVVRCKRRMACRCIPDFQIADPRQLAPRPHLTLAAKSSLGYDKSALAAHPIDVSEETPHSMGAAPNSRAV